MSSQRRNGFLIVWTPRLSIGAVVYRIVGGGYAHTSPGRFRTRAEALAWIDSQDTDDAGPYGLPSAEAHAPRPGQSFGTRPASSPAPASG